MTEEYTHANSIDRDSTVRLDQNGSTSTVDVNFQGVGHLGVLKREMPSTRTEFDYDPTFESREDYAGSFLSTSGQTSTGATSLRQVC